MELLNTLGVNWKMLIAQLVNFGILIVVLSYFVYRPVLRLIDERRERVRKSMEDTKAIENQRREIEQFKNEQMRKVDMETSSFLDTAKKQAESVKKEILASAQKEADQLLEKAKHQLEEERTKLVAEVQSSMATVVVKLSQKILQREFSKEDQGRMLVALEKAIPTLIK